MSIYQPYFYVIQDVRNGMYYAGSKYGKDANQSVFMKEGGYLTSSNTVLNIISEFGISVFRIRVLKSFETSANAYDYETKFLKRVNAKSNPRFYNKHNNDHVFSYHDERYKQKMREIYGVEDPMQSQEIVDRIQASNIEAFGVPWAIMSDNIKAKARRTLKENYDVENPMHSEEIRNNMRINNLNKYGVENVFQTEWAKEKSRATLMKNFGVEHPMYSNKVKQKIEETNVEKYGVKNAFQTEHAKAKIRERVDYLLTRPSLDAIRLYQKRFKLKLGRGWVRKSDEYIDSLLKELQSKYGTM